MCIKSVKEKDYHYIRTRGQQNVTIFRCNIWLSQEGAENKSYEDRQESYAIVNSLGKDKVHTEVSYSQNNR